jgi:predicted RNA binding protein YcfA (HicA-like mRNA interferase family)
MTKDGAAIAVPVHGSYELKSGTLAAIRRQSGLPLN